ncbi:MAG: glycosyltransferase family 4 protein [Deltaproteobacteria bacterium]
MPRKSTHKPLAILHTEASLGWGGQEQRVFVEAQALRQRGHRLAFACDHRGELHRRAHSQGFKINWQTRWLYQNPAAIITTGEATKQLLMQRLGVPARQIFSIPTGVDLTEFIPQEKNRELLDRIKIPPEAFVFGSVAVLRSWKGHLYLLEAFQKLIAEGVRAYLLLVGEGPYRVVIQEKITQLGLKPWVHLAGFRDQVAPWFALMDVVVLASYANEGVPQSLLQAMAMARPVIGTTVGGIPEVVISGETGLLAPPRDPSSLAQVLTRLMTDPDLRRDLGRRGRELVVERFSLEQMAAEIEAVYEVLQRRRAGEGRTKISVQP